MNKCRYIYIHCLSRLLKNNVITMSFLINIIKYSFCVYVVIKNILRYNWEKQFIYFLNIRKYITNNQIYK